MARRYSLEPLVRVRKREVEQRTGELGKAAVGRRKAQAGVDAVRARAAEERRAAKAVRDVERRELEKGGLTARDLVQGELHRAAVTAKLSELARGEAAAAERLARATALEAEAKVALGRARAEEGAVLRHRERLHAELEKKRETEREDDAADRFASVRRGARRR